MAEGVLSVVSDCSRVRTNAPSAARARAIPAPEIVSRPAGALVGSLTSVVLPLLNDVPGLPTRAALHGFDAETVEDGVDRKNRQCVTTHFGTGPNAGLDRAPSWAADLLAVA